MIFCSLVYLIFITSQSQTLIHAWITHLRNDYMGSGMIQMGVKEYLGKDQALTLQLIQVVFRTHSI